MHSTRTPLFVALGLLLMSDAGLVAQRSISFGQSFSSSLDSRDPTSRGSHYEQWVFRGNRGETVTVRMNSSDFDAFLQLGRREGGEFVELAADDDGGEGVNSQIQMTLPASGEYLVRATSLGRGSTGQYRLTLDPRPATLRRNQISLGRTVRGTLDGNGPTERGRPYAEWAFRASPGDAVQIRMSSDAFDTFLSLGHFHSDGSFHELSTNDDADGTNSVIDYTLREGGEYIIRASSYGTSGRGSYTLAVSRAGSHTLSIQTGQARGGTLDSADPTSDGRHYEDWSYVPTRGGAVTISLESTSFDPVLELWLMDGNTFRMISSDDDSGDGVNARLVFTPLANRQYVIRARAYSTGSTGSYTLRVQ